jgi:Uma2 family endonuclease
LREDKQIASLREYVLIGQGEQRIEVFRREQEWHGEVEVNRVYRA